MAGGTPLPSLMVIPEGPKPTFVNVDDKYRCPLCREVLQAAVQTECGHHVCDKCINSELDKKDPVACPKCLPECSVVSRVQRNYFPDKSFQREIVQLPVICSNQRYGCNVAIPWNQLQDHESTCAYAQLTCPHQTYGCDKRLSRSELDRHRDNCDYRPVQCELCGITIGQPSKQDHQDHHCPRAWVSCPYNCEDDSITRDMLTEHKSLCLNRPQKCKLHKFGCSYEASEHDLAHHMKENYNRHLMDLAAVLESVQTEIVKLREEREEYHSENEALKTRVKAVEEENINLRRVIGKQEKIQETHGAQLHRLEVNVQEQEKALTEHASKIVILEDGQKAGTELVRDVHGGDPNSVVYNEMKRQVSQCDRQLGIHDVRIAEMDLRFQLLETASYSGTLLWKIQDYQRRKQDAIQGKVVSLYSQPFYTSRCGYKMCARAYLNGDGMGKGTHLSFFFTLMRGEYDALLPWPFRQKVTLQLLDQDTGQRNLQDTFRPDPNSSSFQRPTKEMNIASGCPMFVSHPVLENGRTYLRDGTLFLKIIVDTSDLYGP